MCALWEKPWDVRIYSAKRLDRKKRYQWGAFQREDSVYSSIVSYGSFKDKKECQASWRKYAQRLGIIKYRYIYDKDKCKIARLLLHVPRVCIKNAE